MAVNCIICWLLQQIIIYYIILLLQITLYANYYNRLIKHSQVENNFAEKHVFEWGDGSGVVNGVVALECFKEVGVGSLPVLLLSCMGDSYNRDDTIVSL